MRPMPRSLRNAAGALLLCGALGLSLTSALAAPEREPPRRSKAAAQGSVELLSRFDPRKRTRRDDRVISRLASGHTAVLTLDPDLDEHIRDVLERYEVPFAGVVALAPATGRVLAYVSHAQDGDHGTDYARDASAPAASVFKLITGSALLESGVRPTTHTCYHGGFSALLPSELEDNPRLDTACVSFTSALSRSVNAVFGKLALKHLSRDKMVRYASAFGFGEPLPFDVPTRISDVDIPRERVEFARTAAGFWHSHMSPLHGALIAATLANEGRMMRPFIVERLDDPRGEVALRGQPRLHRAVIGADTAHHLGTMMQATVTRGTARSSFFDPKGNPFLPGIEVAGKTGTLSRERPYRGYTWWVGFAPADKPQIALAALIVNSPKWRIKASYVAREALRHYLVQKPRIPAAKEAVATR